MPRTEVQGRKEENNSEFATMELKNLSISRLNLWPSANFFKKLSSLSVHVRCHMHGCRLNQVLGRTGEKKQRGGSVRKKST